MSNYSRRKKSRRLQKFTFKKVKKDFQNLINDIQTLSNEVTKIYSRDVKKYVGKRRG